VRAVSVSNSEDAHFEGPISKTDVCPVPEIRRVGFRTAGECSPGLFGNARDLPSIAAMAR